MRPVRWLILFVATFLSACTNYPWTSLAPDVNGARVETLDARCQREAQIDSWTPECLTWKERKDAADAAAQRAEEQARKDEWARIKAERAREERAAEQREAAAVAQDEREGFHHLSFEEFALDAPDMKPGTKVAVSGLYLSEGQRLLRDPMSAARWVELGEGGEGVVIPLATKGATRAARATLLHCSGAPLGCPVVVRGKVEVLMMRNRLGASWAEIGIAVEDIR